MDMWSHSIYSANDESESELNWRLLFIVISLYLFIKSVFDFTDITDSAEIERFICNWMERAIHRKQTVLIMGRTSLQISIKIFNTGQNTQIGPGT